jgi:hypothetical protein
MQAHQNQWHGYGLTDVGNSYQQQQQQQYQVMIVYSYRDLLITITITIALSGGVTVATRPFLNAKP